MLSVPTRPHRKPTPPPLPPPRGTPTALRVGAIVPWRTTGEKMVAPQTTPRNVKSAVTRREVSTAPPSRKQPTVEPSRSGTDTDSWWPAARRCARGRTTLRPRMLQARSTSLVFGGKQREGGHPTRYHRCWSRRPMSLLISFSFCALTMRADLTPASTNKTTPRPISTRFPSPVDPCAIP
jgi:hypothetical protein